MAPVKGKKKTRAPLDKALLPGSSRPSNPSQVQVQMWLEQPTTLLTTQATTGLMSTPTVTPTLSTFNMASSFSMYDEYRFLEVRFHLVPNNGVTTGVTKFILDDEDNTTPTRTYVESRRGWLLSNNSSQKDSIKTLVWRAEALEDLEWYSVYSQASNFFVCLKNYTDAANYNAPSSSNLWACRVEVLVQFRGIGAGR